MWDIIMFSKSCYSQEGFCLLNNTWPITNGDHIICMSHVLTLESKIIPNYGPLVRRREDRRSKTRL